MLSLEEHWASVGVCVCVCVWCVCKTGVYVRAHVDNVCDKWRGRRQQPHSRACNPTLPPSDGDEEIMRPNSAVCAHARVCVCVCVCVLGDEE